MLLGVKVADNGNYPPLLTRDDLLTMIRVEDQFGGRRIRRLLTGLHHDDQQSIKLVAENLDVPLDQLRRWMYWLQIEILEIELLIPPQEKHVTEDVVEAPGQDDQVLSVDENGFQPDPANTSRFLHVPTGLIFSKDMKERIESICRVHNCTLAELCQEPYYKPGILVTMSDEVHNIPTGVYEKFVLCYRGTLEEMAKTDFPAAEKTVQPEEIKHPTGIMLTSRDKQAIDQYCSQHNCTEEEFFRYHFDVTRIVDIANEIGINPNLCIHLWNYYRPKEEPVAGG